MTLFPRLLALPLLALALGSPAAAAGLRLVAEPADGVVTTLGASPGLPGVYGAELRIGNDALNGTWELGVGPQTSVAGSFAQAQYRQAGGAALPALARA